MPAFSEDVLLPIVRADLRARRGPFYSHWVANDLAGADGSGYSLRAPIHLIHGADDELCPRINADLVTDYLKSTQSRSNVDSDYLASNEVMKAAHYLAGQTYHALYAPLAFVRGRRAWLFSDTPAGANASAMIYSMVETAKANGHEPHSWLNHVMRELPKAREMKSYDHLLPWNLNAADLIRDAYLREAPSS